MKLLVKDNIRLQKGQYTFTKVRGEERKSPLNQLSCLPSTWTIRMKIRKSCRSAGKTASNYYMSERLKCPCMLIYETSIFQIQGCELNIEMLKKHFISVIRERWTEILLSQMIVVI